MILRHERHGLGPEYLVAVKSAAMQEHLRERQVVPGSTIEPTTAHMKLWLLGQLHCSRLQRAGVTPLIDRCQACAHRWGHLEGGVVHAERLANVLRSIALGAVGAVRFDDVAKPIDADTVFPALARITQ